MLISCINLLKGSNLVVIVPEPSISEVPSITIKFKFLPLILTLSIPNKLWNITRFLVKAFILGSKKFMWLRIGFLPFHNSSCLDTEFIAYKLFVTELAFIVSYATLPSALITALVELSNPYWDWSFAKFFICVFCLITFTLSISGKIFLGISSFNIFIGFALNSFIYFCCKAVFCGSLSILLNALKILNIYFNP